MPYQPNASDELPPDPNQKVWRYMDLGKFISIVSTQTLWFPTVEDLIKLDPWEGAIPTNHLEGVQEQIRQKLAFIDTSSVAIAALKQQIEDRKAEIVKNETEGIKNLLTSLRQATYVNCWHYNDYESAAMWSQYAGYGIAIKSTVKRLKECFSDGKNIRLAKIKYMDYDDFKKYPLDLNRTYLTKRKSFESEQEVRAFLTDSDLWDKHNYDLSVPEAARKLMADHVPRFATLFALKYVSGLPIRIKPDVLIEEVLVSPTAAGYLVQAAEAVFDKFKLTIKVTKSSLYDLPK